MFKFFNCVGEPLEGIYSMETDIGMAQADDVSARSNDGGDVLEVSKLDADVILLEDLKEQAKCIEKYVTTKEPRFMYRVLRSLTSTRKKLNARVLRKLVSGYYGSQKDLRDYLLHLLDASVPVDEEQSKEIRMRKSKLSLLPFLSEIDVYFQLLVLLYLIDSERYDSALMAADLLMKSVQDQSRRSLYAIAAKCYFYLTRCYELCGRLADIRKFLLERFRTAILKNDSDGQAVLLNCLLRNYLHYNLYEQATKLVTKSSFPETASNSEWARFYFYQGRIEAVQLNYPDACTNLLRAIRKAPQLAAVGFKQAAHKLLVTVELLLGEIPDRSLFRRPHLRRSLLPYFQLTQAVRNGDLGLFNEVIENFGPTFEADHTYNLIIRLRHNVIRTGIRMISLSYSSIGFSDIKTKLQLDSSEDVEYIVAKAIKDGVIESTIDHTEGFMRSKENIDVYCTKEPQRAFHQRIAFCLDVHKKSITAMRFPPKPPCKDLEPINGSREADELILDIDLADFDDSDEYF